MSLTRRIFFGVAASWFSRGIAIVLGLVLMPVLFRTLPKEELGIWLLLGQSWATLGLLDFGFGVTLTRRIAFAKGKSGSDPDVKLTDASRQEIADLVTTGLRIYRVLSVVAFSISFSLGFLYLRTLELDTLSLPTVWAAWGILCLSQALTVWATPWTCLLQGVGYVGWDAIIASFVNALTLLAQIAGALLGGGLTGLAIIAAAGTLMQRVCILTFARHKRSDLFKLRGNWQPQVFTEMRPLALRAWGTAIGVVLIFNIDSLLVTSICGSEQLPAYQAAWLLVRNLGIVAETLAVQSGVFVSHLWQSKQLPGILDLLERNIKFAWLTTTIGAGVVVIAGESLFDLWLGPGNFVGFELLLVLLINEALTAHDRCFACAARATGDEDFVWSWLPAGFLKIAFAIVLGLWLGRVGVATGTFLAMLLTCHWHIPRRGMRRLDYGWPRLFARTAVPSALAALPTLAAAFLTGHMSRDLAPAARLSAIALIAGLGLFVSCWVLLLDHQQRNRSITLLLRRPKGSPAL